MTTSWTFAAAKRARTRGKSSLELMDKESQSGFVALGIRTRKAGLLRRPAYNFVIGADGQLMKCTVVLGKRISIVGRLSDNGDLLLDLDKMALWTEPAFEHDQGCQKCTLLPACQGMHCRWYAWKRIWLRARGRTKCARNCCWREIAPEHPHERRLASQIRGMPGAGPCRTAPWRRLHAAAERLTADQLRPHGYDYRCIRICSRSFWRVFAVATFVDRCTLRCVTIFFPAKSFTRTVWLRAASGRERRNARAECRHPSDRPVQADPGANPGRRQRHRCAFHWAAFPFIPVGLGSLGFPVTPVPSTDASDKYAPYSSFTGEENSGRPGPRCVPKPFLASRWSIPTGSRTCCIV